MWTRTCGDYHKTARARGAGSWAGWTRTTAAPCGPKLADQAEKNNQWSAKWPSSINENSQRQIGI
jgi:hypothetical protein